MKNKIRLLIADDHELFRKGIISLLIECDDIQIIGEANNGKDLIYKFLKLNPDVVLTDISMPELSGIEAIKTLSKSHPDIKAIFLSMLSGDEYVYHCYTSGGSGLINKDIHKEDLLDAIRAVSEGKKYFGKDYPPEKIKSLLESYKKQESGNEDIKKVVFTEQETQVLLLIAEGDTSEDIADKMYISKRTVDSHRSNIIRKLNLKTGPQLLKYAIRFAESQKQNDIK